MVHLNEDVLYFFYCLGRIYLYRERYRDCNNKTISTPSQKTQYKHILIHVVIIEERPFYLAPAHIRSGVRNNFACLKSSVTAP